MNVRTIHTMDSFNTIALYFIRIYYTHRYLWRKCGVICMCLHIVYIFSGNLYNIHTLLVRGYMCFIIASTFGRLCACEWRKLCTKNQQQTFPLLISCRYALISHWVCDIPLNDLLCEFNQRQYIYIGMLHNCCKYDLNSASINVAFIICQHFYFAIRQNDPNWFTFRNAQGYPTFL